jgi:hypothetical protein
MSDAATDRVTFAHEHLSIEPFEHQAEALRSDCPYIYLVGGRRSGKTRAAQVAAIHACVTHRDVECIVTGPNGDRVRLAVEDTRDLIAGSPLGRDLTFDAQAMRLDFKGSGSSMVGVVPTGGQLRGRGARVMIVWVDEAGHTSPQLARDIRYLIADNRARGSQLWATGSPWGSRDHWFRQGWQRGRDGDPDFLSAQWRSTDNPRVPAEWIERERARLNAIEAAAELDGEWQEDGLQFFPHALLEANVADVELPPIAALRGPARTVVGVDFGVSWARSAATFLYRASLLNGDKRPVFIACPYVWPSGTELAQVVSEIVACPAYFAYLGVEQTGPGAMPVQELRRLIPEAHKGEQRWWCVIDTTAALKLAAYSLVRWLLERRQLILPRDPTVLSELAGVRIEQSARVPRIGPEDDTSHDDICDSIAFATLPYVRGGQLVCGLGDLADAERAAGAAYVPPLDQPAVATGDGTWRLYQRPALQSIDGPEVSLPAGVPVADPVKQRHAELRAQVQELLRKGATQ